MDMNISESENLTEFSSNNDLYSATILRVNSLLTREHAMVLGNVTQFLSDWQITQLADTDLDSGILCLLNIWFGDSHNDTENGLHCDGVWDNIYCWPPTLAGTTTKRSCTEVLETTGHLNGQKINGYAVRKCLKNGTWSRGIRTNYSECAKALLKLSNISKEEPLNVFVKYMVFFGSIASLLCLGIALAMLCGFRYVWNERMKIHVHLMLSLSLRFVVFIIISEPLVSQRSSSYRDNNVLCKSVLIAHLYATVASTSWMLVQGIYVNGKLSTNVFGFRKRRDFLKFYIIGWGLPAVIIVIYLIAMMANEHLEDCWVGYAGMTEIWIILVPVKAEMLLTGILLCNILRIVVKKKRIISESLEFTQIKSIAKVTLVLSPILGLNNLLFLYNPGGKYETLYVSLNISFGSTQGVLVAIVYCFNCPEVHKAI